MNNRNIKTKHLSYKEEYKYMKNPLVVLLFVFFLFEIFDFYL